jgi:hypothetical protein
MRFLICFAVLTAVACRDSDPHIEAQRTVEYPSGDVRAGTFGAGYDHGGKADHYEGPASKAPPWTKD